MTLWLRGPCLVTDSCRGVGAWWWGVVSVAGFVVVGVAWCGRECGEG